MQPLARLAQLLALAGQPGEIGPGLTGHAGHAACRQLRGLQVEHVTRLEERARRDLSSPELQRQSAQRRPASAHIEQRLLPVGGEALSRAKYPPEQQPPEGAQRARRLRRESLALPRQLCLTCAYVAAGRQNEGLQAQQHRHRIFALGRHSEVQAVNLVPVPREILVEAFQHGIRAGVALERLE
jgi:hypothetical protein